MKIYVYEGLDKKGRASYRVIELDENQKGGEWQAVLDKLNSEEYNNDRRHLYWQDKLQVIKIEKLEDDEDVVKELSRMDLIPDNTDNPEIQFLKSEAKDEAKALTEFVLASVSEKQKRRLIEYYINEKTLSEIANEEGVHLSTIDESIKSAIKKIQKNLSKYPEK